MYPSTTTGYSEWGNNFQPTAHEIFWNNIFNMLDTTSDYSFTSSQVVTTGWLTYECAFYNWDSRTSIPDDAVINDIDFYFWGNVNSGVADWRMYALFPGAGSPIAVAASSAFTSNIPGSKTILNKTIDDYGITNQEALDAIRATSSSAGIRFYAEVENGGASAQFFLRQVQMRLGWSTHTPHMLLTR